MLSMKEMFDSQDNLNFQKHITELNQWELADTLKDSQETVDSEIISHIFQNLLAPQNLENYHCYMDSEQQSSDWDLYTIIKYHNKNLMVKVGAGEFTTKVFTTGNIYELRWFYNSPIPLFVVNQWHNSWWNDEALLLKITNPKKYLDIYAKIVSPKWWEAYFRSNQQRYKQKIDYMPIHIANYEDVILLGRNALLQKEFSELEFNKIIKKIKKLKILDFEKFYTQIRKGRKFLSEEMQKLIWCLRKMGISSVGAWVWNKESFWWLYTLIQSFDTHKKIFMPIDYTS